MAIKLLRVFYGGQLADADWTGWRLRHGRLYPPTGNHSYAPWELEQLEAILRQATQFRALFNRLYPVRHLDPPTIIRAITPEDDLTLRKDTTPLSPTKP
jgi:hypothetical protein